MNLILPLKKLVVRLTHRIPLLAYANRLHHSSIAQLFQTHAWDETIWRLGMVRLDAAHISTMVWKGGGSKWGTQSNPDGPEQAVQMVKEC